MRLPNKIQGLRISDLAAPRPGGVHGLWQQTVARLMLGLFDSDGLNVNDNDNDNDNIGAAGLRQFLFYMSTVGQPLSA